MSAHEVGRRRRAARRRASCWPRCSSGSSSTGRRVSRDVAAPAPLQPYRELRRLWGKSSGRRRGDDARLPARARRRGRERSARPCCSSRLPAARPSSASATTRSRCAGLLALARFAVAAAAWDVGQRLLADGREPRPHDLGVRRGDARPLARGRGARRRHDRSRGDRRGHRRRPTSGRARRSRSRRSRSRSSSSPRRAGSRSTTRTRISS